MTLNALHCHIFFCFSNFSSGSHYLHNWLSNSPYVMKFTKGFGHFTKRVLVTDTVYNQPETGYHSGDMSAHSWVSLESLIVEFPKFREKRFEGRMFFK